MYTGRFGRLLFVSEREATSIIPTVASCKVRLYTVSTLLHLWRRWQLKQVRSLTFDTLALVQQNQHRPWLARKLVEKWQGCPWCQCNSGPWVEFSQLQYIGILPTNTKFAKSFSPWKKPAIWYCEEVYGCQALPTDMDSGNTGEILVLYKNKAR